MKKLLIRIITPLIASLTRASEITRTARRERARMQTNLLRAMHPLTKL